MKWFCILVMQIHVTLIFAQPISLHPLNPHYLIYKDAPILLITSAEHYGAVLNKDFDYHTYLKTLHDEGMNYTRIFTGSYVEVPGSFGIKHNTLAPESGQFIAPWTRVDEISLYTEEKKFDLNQWNTDYFKRLHNFIQEASDLDIIVEVTFFCATYQDANWMRHPFNPGNNINIKTHFDRRDFNTSINKEVLHFQKELIRKLTRELNKYDNVLFELCNEPWADNGVKTSFLHKTIIPKEGNLGWILWSTAASKQTLDWQKDLAQTFRESEAEFPKKHLLAQNFSNFKEILTEVNDDIDILNFHYAWPEAVSQNYGWNRPVNFDESGFAGSSDSIYLQQAWSFMLSGGAIFNNLDYSFYPGRESGTGENDAPGGGSNILRKQLKFLKEFLSAFDYVKMKPANELILHSPGLETYCLAETGTAYAIFGYGRNQGLLEINLAKGNFEIIIYNPDNMQKLSQKSFEHQGGNFILDIPRTPRTAIQIIRS
ncbi:MAG: cellulase family glycosylhydrolase [Saprospiraceae bacterium]|nr:cellulase family glycosylhydrolase [Saprospiraceae bacterium]